VKKLVMVLMLTPAALFATGMQDTQGTARSGMPMMMSCPMTLQGTSVSVADTPTGVAISLTTKTENVAELRQRVQQMATMHGGQLSSEAMKQGQMMPGTIKYEEIENGARLTLTPREPAKLDEFRKQVRAHVERMQKGDCSMMNDMMQGMMGGMGKPGANPQPKKD
jgi:hypothetical protein